MPTAGSYAADQIDIAGQVVEVLGRRVLLKTSLIVRVVVIINRSHSNAPKTVAALSDPQRFSSAGHALLHVLTATAMKPTGTAVSRVIKFCSRGMMSSAVYVEDTVSVLFRPLGGTRT